MANLVGKNILIVDEVDDTRTTLEYAVRELQKDVEKAAQQAGSTEPTRFSIFVLHVRWSNHGDSTRTCSDLANAMQPQNKDKTKKGHLPQTMMDDGKYLAARTVSDVWICYPWEATYVPAFRASFMQSPHTF